MASVASLGTVKQAWKASSCHAWSCGGISYGSELLLQASGLVPLREDPEEVYKAESCQPGLRFLRSALILQQESPIYSLHILVGAWESPRSLPRPPSHPGSVLAVSAEGSQACAKGCELCSEVNGCLKCSPKLFILLERNDIRQVGVCLPSCPPGYFDARNPDVNKCISECGQGWRRAPETPGPGEGAWNCWWPARGVVGSPRTGDEASHSSIRLLLARCLPRYPIHISTFICR